MSNNYPKPPEAQPNASQPPATQPRPKQPAERPAPPEVVHYALRCWWAVVALEVVHQVMNFLIGFQGRGELRKQIADSLQPGQEYSPQLLDAATVFALALATALSLLILGLMAWLIATYGKGGKRAEFARKVLTYYAIYLAIRAMMLFALQPVGHVPTAYYAVDGCLQMLAGVLAVLALIYASRKESLEYSGGSDTKAG